MTDALFPVRARGGITEPHWGTDCDYWDHRHKGDAPSPELTATERGEVGRLYSPDGTRVRVVYEERPSVPFGLRGKEAS